MGHSTMSQRIEDRLAQLSAAELRRLLIEHLTKQKLGLTWEYDAIERDEALNADVVLPRLREDLSCSSSDRPGDPYRNLIIEGDNFDALRLLRTTHGNKVRVIYIDPPYNTGNRDWVYNDKYVRTTDRWRHSMWLEFLYQRLLIAKDLLAPDGVILVSINDENRARLDLLMEEVFPGIRIGSLVWRTRDTTSVKERNFSDVHEHILVYGGEQFAFNGREKTQKKYRNPDNDSRGPWNADPLTLAFDRFERENLYYPIQRPVGGTPVTKTACGPMQPRLASRKVRLFKRRRWRSTSAGSRFSSLRTSASLSGSRSTTCLHQSTLGTCRLRQSASDLS